MIISEQAVASCMEAAEDKARIYRVANLVETPPSNCCEAMEIFREAAFDVGDILNEVGRSPAASLGVPPLDKAPTNRRSAKVPAADAILPVEPAEVVSAGFQRAGGGNVSRIDSDLYAIETEIDELTLFGIMRPMPKPQPDPVISLVIAHCRALAAYEATCRAAGDEREVEQLCAEEHEARKALLPFVPRTLRGLQVKLAYALAFSIPAWADNDPGDEPIQLLQSTSKALAKLLG